MEKRGRRETVRGEESLEGGKGEIGWCEGMAEGRGKEGGRWFLRGT
jgi:hypothetical protein